MAPTLLHRVALLAAAPLVANAGPTYKVLPRAVLDPFAPLDPQKWVNPDAMTWDDWKAVPGVDWADPTRRGSIKNWNIALVAVDFSDKPFTITQPSKSTIFGNPQPAANNIPRERVPAFYRDFLNAPQPLNRRHTLHEYWMQDSFGRYGVNLTAYGPYRMPQQSWQYGIDKEDFNKGGCPSTSSSDCQSDIGEHAEEAWQRDVGKATVDSHPLVFIMSAGQDESSSWQEFGEMKFASPEQVPREFGPPAETKAAGKGNWGHTRYVNWTSWASASTIWPYAGEKSSIQAESSGMAVYAHELSHLLDIGDNYGNPWDKPTRRDYVGPFSMMSRGSFNGPGGPHTRWQIPAQQGSSLGSLHTVRDKLKIGLVDKKNVLELSREGLAKEAVVVRRVISRAVNPGDGLIGIYVNMDKDRSKACSVKTDPLCDGGGYQFYTLEVVDRMGADSFQPDSGVFITKSHRTDDADPYQWAIDANPSDINIVDFVAANGKTVKIGMGDYRQLLDALFHAGTRSGSKFEYVDRDNRLHFYILTAQRDPTGVLSYDIGIRSLDSTGGTGVTLGVGLGDGSVDKTGGLTATGKGVFCSFSLKNKGSGPGSDVYRLKTAVKNGAGWRVALPTEVVAVKFGEQTEVKVAVGAAASADKEAVVELVATSELGSKVSATATCRVSK